MVDDGYFPAGKFSVHNGSEFIQACLQLISRYAPQLLFIHDAGAHGFAMGYNYNGKLRSAEVLLKEDGSTELIRRAETPADYFATFDFTGLFKNILAE